MKCPIIWGLLLSGCYSEWKVEDVDGDGFNSINGDCWDSVNNPVVPEGALDYGLTAADIYAGADDLPYDGIDANCDGQNDFDVDGDGFVAAQYVGIPTIGIEGSEETPGGDCWDNPGPISPQEILVNNQLTGADVNPAAIEIFYDGIDQNCGEDNDFDADGDGFVPDAYEGFATQGLGLADLPAGDCWDWDDNEYVNPLNEWMAADVNPGATEVWYDGTDLDCDGVDDCDQDNDGFLSGDNYCSEIIGEASLDCNDLNELIYPNDEVEIYYNGIDDNCNWDDGDGDKDGDGFWDINYPFTETEVDVSVDYPDTLDDCWDDEDAIADGFDALNGLSQPSATEVFPGAIESSYDGVNQDCGSDNSTEFDQDGDGDNTEHYLDRNGQSGNDCIDSVDDPGYVDVGIAPSEIYSGYPTDIWYDGIDQNCDGVSDFDQDGDSQDSNDYGGLDCDDQDEDIFFGNADEFVNDGMDGNCDGMELCYIDSDADGFGNSGGSYAESSSLNCSASGFSNNTSDCDDSDGTISPNATELCDGQVNDCSGSLPTDEIDNDGDGYVECSIDSGGWDGSGAVIGGSDCDDGDATLTPDNIWYSDNDSDGYGDPGQSTNACTLPTGFVVDSTDCDDTEDTVYPSALERCDGQLNNCNTSIIPGYEVDDDGDGYVECSIDSDGWDGSGAVVGGDDCDDANATLTPVDGDGDGHSSCTGDCDDAEATVFSGATELCDGQINNCNTVTLAADEVDDDGDGYVECSIDSGGWDGSGASMNGADCDPSDPDVYPGAPEIVADNIDQNCNGTERCYVDNDGDTYGSTTIGSSYSESCYVAGFSTTSDDCDDADPALYPYDGDGDGETLCDYDCDDGDEYTYVGAAVYDSSTLCMTDYDGDGYGDDSPASGVIAGTDCDDDDDDTFVGAAPYDDSFACMTDYDGDGYGDSVVSSSNIDAGTDCNDGSSIIHPWATEYATYTDYNCDGLEALGYGSCEGQWYFYSGYDKYFLYCDTTESWSTSNALCQAAGYDALASINSSSENSSVTSLSDSTAWIGFNDRVVENTFVWADGSGVSYTNWDSGIGWSQPDDFFGEDCGEIYNNGTWNDDDCGDDDQGFICSYY